MEEKKLNLDAPFLSVRRVPTKPDDPNESENTKKKTMTTRRREIKDSCQETENEILIRLLQDQSFEHVMEPSSVPFKWEQTPGKPKDKKNLVEESDLIKAMEMVSSTASFSVNCSSSGVSEFENNGDGDRSSNVSRDDVILEYRDLIMSRFLPAAEAISLKMKKEASRVKAEKKKKQSIALQRVSMAINQDLNNDVDDEEHCDHNHVDGIDALVYSNDSKKGQLGFLPWFCSKNSVDVLTPVLSRIKTCQDVGVKSENIINPKSIDSVYKTKSTSPRIFKSSKVMSKSQEIDATPRFSNDISRISLPKSRETLQIPRNHSRLQQTTDQNQRQEIRFLVEEVKRRSNRNKNRSENLSVSQPPLPKTPSESWLCRTLPRSSTTSSVVSGQFAVVVSGQAARFKKNMEKKTDSQSKKWETIVKTSYSHHDHVRYSEGLIVVHPTRQHKF
ncbi:hypothetical protein ISN44_As05g040740 [Arabidopsis suecica]|uniref:Uncharacterized protein n=2 Tax=Arabidopsis TaxID=3701 RepID=F4KEN8_ARATH|nr:hypothetical protein (DUF688) [Arabidopsis thaliana]AED95307.1 hypothetical protein (DUF688) [Arabidopsis thaliana]KAG7612011.1 hypothetical protein ISN44_As05g040740 [Arabidopsis suecica]|eukprot:NP_199397.2 hypothetical protein (DUF688) [Arabidopsis thaliana]